MNVFDVIHLGLPSDSPLVVQQWTVYIHGVVLVDEVTEQAYLLVESFLLLLVSVEGLEVIGWSPLLLIQRTLFVSVNHRVIGNNGHLLPTLSLHTLLIELEVVDTADGAHQLGSLPLGESVADVGVVVGLVADDGGWFDEERGGFVGVAVLVVGVESFAGHSGVFVGVHLERGYYVAF